MASIRFSHLAELTIEHMYILWPIIAEILLVEW